MTATCPHCGSLRLVGKGRCSPTFHRIRDGVAVPYKATALRVLCRACGRNGSVYDPVDLAAERAVRSHVVERVFALGQSAAALETGVPRTTVQRHVEAWCASRELEVLDAAPDFLLLEPVRICGIDRVMIVDVDREALVEILTAGEAVRGWLCDPGRPSALRICTPPDPSIVRLVGSALPNVRTMVSPSAAARAVRTEADLGFRFLRRRGKASGCNGMPTASEFQRSLAREGAPGPGWPRMVAALATAARAALDLLGSRSREEGERRWAETELAAAGAERILRWLRVWREPVLEGLDHAFVNATAKLAAGVRRAIARRRPVLGFTDLRAFVLLRDFVRRSVPVPPGFPPRAISEGRPLAGLAAMLTP